MKKSSIGPPLGESEMEVLEHIWESGKVTVADIHAQISQKRKVAYTTIMTIMKKLATKGYLHLEKDGTAYRYWAARPASEVRHSLLTGILKKVFGGSPVELVESLVRYEQLSDRERAEIMDLLDGMEDDDATTA